MDNELNELINAWNLCNTGTTNAIQQQAFNYIENFKQNSQYIIDIGFNLISRHDSVNSVVKPELIHFGTQLITHTIKFKWNILNYEKKLFIKNELFNILNSKSLSGCDGSSLITKHQYLKNSICLTYLELIKREWPQNWPTLLDELYSISKNSLQHLNLILNLFKLMADEFVINNSNLPQSRRKDINQYLNANMSQIFAFFLDTLNQFYEVYTQQNIDELFNSTNANFDHKLIINLLNMCLDCLSYYIDWIQIGIVLSRNALLINLILNLLNTKYLCLNAAKCLIVFVSRKSGDLNERKPLLELFSDYSLNQIFNCIKMSLTQSNANKDLLKYLLQILIEMGMQLNSQWIDDKFQIPKQFNVYLSAIYEFTINNSKQLSYEAIQLWSKFLSNDNIKLNSVFADYIKQLTFNLTNTYILYKINTCKQLTSEYDEFDSDDDLNKFIIKYRIELAKLIRLSTQLYMDVCVDTAYKWAIKIIQESIPSASSLGDSDVSVLSQGYNINSYLYLSWDALLFLWSNIMQIISKQIKLKQLTVNSNSTILNNLNCLLKHSIEYKVINANLTSYNLSLLSSLLCVCDIYMDNETGDATFNNSQHVELMLKIILEKLFNEFNYFKTINETNVDQHFMSQTSVQTPISSTYSTKPLKLKCVLNVRRQCAAIILNICRNYTKIIKKFFNYIYENINNLLNEKIKNEDVKDGGNNNNNKILTQMEQIIFIEALIYCSNEFNSYDLQMQFINENLTQIKEFFLLNKEFLYSIDDVNNFCLFIGLTSQQQPQQVIDLNLMQTQTKLICLSNRKQIFFAVNALFGILKCIQVPVELNESNRIQLANNGYLDPVTLNIRNPGYIFYIQLFEHLIKLLKCMNMLHLNDVNEKFFIQYKNCLKMTDAIKVLSLGMQQQSTANAYENKHIDVNESISENTAAVVSNSTTTEQYDSDKLLMFIYNTYDTLNQLISLYFIKFKNEILFTTINDTNIEFAYKFGEALFTCFQNLPDYRMRTLIRYILKSLLECSLQLTLEDINKQLFIIKFNQLLLEHFLPSILQRINEKNKYYKQLNDMLQQNDSDDIATSTCGNKIELNEKQIEEQIIDENQFTLMCRDIVEFIKLFFSFNTTSSSTNPLQPQQQQQQHNNIDDENADDAENNDFMENNVIKSNNSNRPMSELAIYLMNNSQIIYQAVLLILFEGLCWNDSWCCTRLVRLAHILIDTFPVITTPQQQQQKQQAEIFQLCLNEQISSQFFASCLNALQLHGEHADTSSSLINLAFLIYDKFSLSCHVLFNDILSKIPNLNQKQFQDLLFKYKQTYTSNIDKHKKEKKDLFKKILQPIVGKNIGQLYKNEIIIRSLPPLISQTTRNNRKRFQQQRTHFGENFNFEYYNDNENSNPADELSICKLFDPNV